MIALSAGSRPWVGLIVLTIVSLAGGAPARSGANTIERERLLQRAGETLDKLPHNIGGWTGVVEPVSEEVVARSACRVCISRTYTRSDSGDRVSLLLMAGSADPLAALPPGTTASGDKLVPMNASQTQTIDGENEFLELQLRTEEESNASLRSYVAWRKPRGHWQAPQNPRTTLGTQPMLFRLQVTADLRSANSDPLREFLVSVIPAIESTLAGNSQ